MQGRYGRYKTFTPAPSQPSSIDWFTKLKGLLEMRFEDPVTDATLQDCIASAIDYVEEFTGRILRVGTIQVQYEYWNGMFPLPFLPFRSDLTVTNLSDVAIEHTKSFNFLDLEATKGCVIGYEAGYGDQCPPSLQMAVLKTALTMYETRSNVAIGTISSKIPQNAEDLMAVFVINQDS